MQGQVDGLIELAYFSGILISVLPKKNTITTSLVYQQILLHSIPRSIANLLITEY
jgi:hypothetical protein